MPVWVSAHAIFAEHDAYADSLLPVRSRGDPSERRARRRDDRRLGPRAASDRQERSVRDSQKLADARSNLYGVTGDGPGVAATR